MFIVSNVEQLIFPWIEEFPVKSVDNVGTLKAQFCGLFLCFHFSSLENKVQPPPLKCIDYHMVLPEDFCMAFTFLPRGAEL